MVVTQGTLTNNSKLDLEDRTYKSSTQIPKSIYWMQCKEIVKHGGRRTKVRRLSTGTIDAAMRQ